MVTVVLLITVAVEVVWALMTGGQEALATIDFIAPLILLLTHVSIPYWCNYLIPKLLDVLITNTSSLDNVGCSLEESKYYYHH